MEAGGAMPIALSAAPRALVAPQPHVSFRQLGRSGAVRGWLDARSLSRLGRCHISRRAAAGESSAGTAEVVWFRPGDLRVEDHLGLRAAAASAACLCLCASGPRRQVRALSRTLWRRYQLHLEHVPGGDAGAAAVAELAKKCNASLVHVHEEPSESHHDFSPLDEAAAVKWWTAPLRDGLTELEQDCDSFNLYEEQANGKPMMVPLPPPETLPVDALATADGGEAAASEEEPEAEGEALAKQLVSEWRENPQGFVERHLPEVTDPAEAKEEWALMRIVKGRGLDGLNAGEVFWRKMSPLVGSGAISLRSVAEAAKGSPEVLAAIDAKEWHRLLALKDVSESPSPDLCRYWRWRGHLIRYVDRGQGPCVLCLHGFAASSDQFSGLMKQLPDRRLVALDILGFGHSEKPPLSYTQYLWENVVKDFVAEVVREPCTIIGNSLGGYFAAATACSLGDSCKGLVLMNSAGPLLEKAAWEAEKGNAGTILERMRRDCSSLPSHNPPPQWLIDLGVSFLFSVLFANIRPILGTLYPGRPDRVTEELCETIRRDAQDPFAKVVIGSFSRLAPNRSLNELIEGYGGKVLVLQGMADRLGGGPANQPKRVGILVDACGAEARRLDGLGHCPHDEAPELVADEIRKWTMA